MPKKQQPPSSPEPRIFRSVEEIDRGILKLKRRIEELVTLDIMAAIVHHTGADAVAESNIRESIKRRFRLELA